jgi:hypothetical protein
MRIEPRPSDVRRIVLEMFGQFGESPECLSDVEEEILIAVGGYSAWTYRTGDLMAMWMVEVGIVQFYDAEGNMLATVNLLEELTPQQVAA